MMPEVDLRRRAIILMQDLARGVHTAANALNLIARPTRNRKEVEEVYEKIRSYNADLKAKKKQLISTLMKTGPILTGRDKLIRLVGGLSAMMDGIEAVAFRLVHYDKLRRLPRDLEEGIASILEKLSDAISYIRECIFLMGSNPARVNDVSDRIIKKEAEIDETYRRLELELFNTDLDPMTVIAVTEILRRIEQISDETLDVVDLITILVVI